MIGYLDSEEQDFYSNTCDDCYSVQTRYDPVFEFWKCEECGLVWAGEGTENPRVRSSSLRPGIDTVISQPEKGEFKQD